MTSFLFSAVSMNTNTDYVSTDMILVMYTVPVSDMFTLITLIHYCTPSYSRLEGKQRLQSYAYLL